MELVESTRQILEIYQKNEISEYHIYKNFSKLIQDDKNREILKQIAKD